MHALPTRASQLRWTTMLLGAPMPDSPRPEGERIAKLLARAGVASRREVERMIAEGRVALDGKVLDTAGDDPAEPAGVTVDGKPVAAGRAGAAVRASTSPPGLITAERDPARPADDLHRAAQRAAQGHAAGDAGRPARPQHRGPAAADQRRRAQARARAALVRRAAHLPRAHVRRGHPGAARRADRGGRDRRHALRQDRGRSRARRSRAATSGSS